MKRISVLAGLAALTITAGACTGSSSEPAPGSETSVAAGETTPSAEPVSDCKLDKSFKIGYAADFDLGAIGDKPASAAIKFMVDEINAKGGVGGKPVEFEVKQISQTPPDLAAAQRGVQELIDDGAHLLIGPPFSDYGLPILEVTKGKIPTLFATSTEVVLSDPSKGSFLVSFNDKVQGSTAGEFAFKRDFKTAVTMSSQEIPYLNVNPAAFTEVFTANGGSVVKDLSYKLGTTDFSAQVNEIAAMKPVPDAIYSAFFLPEAGVFLKQLRAAGVNSAVISADGFDASAVWTIGKDAEGVFFTTHTFPEPANDVQAFLDDYAKSDNDKIETVAFGVLGADAAKIAFAAVEKACSTDGQKLIDAINTLKVKGVSGDIDYNGSGGTPKRNVAVLSVLDGKPVLTDSFYPATIAK